MGAAGAPLPTLLDQKAYVGQAFDARVEPALVSQVLTLLQDTHSDVKNLAVTTGSRFATMTEALCAALRSDDEEERDIASMASERCADTTQALVNVLVPFLATQINENTHQTTALDVLNDALTLAPSHMATHQGSIAHVLLAHMASERSAVARRAIQGLAHLAALCMPATWVLITDRGLAGLSPPFHAETASVQLLQALAREAPVSIQAQAAIRVEQLHSVLQRADGHDETDELRETCLLTLQAMVAAGLDVQTRLVIAHMAQSALAYDPNAADDMDDMDDDDALDVSDDDDLAWRVRRAACRLLSELFSAPDAHELCAASPAISAALCERLREREEAVRLDALTALRLVWRACTDAPLDSHVLVEALRTWRSASAQAAALAALSELAERRMLATHDEPVVLSMALYALENDAHAASYIAALVLVRYMCCQALAMAQEAASRLAASLAHAVRSTNHRASVEALHTCEPFFANVGPTAPGPACTLVDAVLARCERADADASVHDAGLVALNTALRALGERAGERIPRMLAFINARLSLETTRTRCLQLVQSWTPEQVLGSFEPVQEFALTCLPLLADLAQRPATAVNALEALSTVSRMKPSHVHGVRDAVRHMVVHNLPAPDSPSLLPLLELVNRFSNLDQSWAEETLDALLPPLVPQLARMSSPSFNVLLDTMSFLTSSYEQLTVLFTALVHAWVAQSSELASQTLGYMTISEQVANLRNWPKAQAVFAQASASTVPGQAMAVTGLLIGSPACRAPFVQALANGDVGALRALRDPIKRSPYVFYSEEPTVWTSVMGPTFCAAAPDMTSECVAYMVWMDTQMKMGSEREFTLLHELMQRMTAPDACGRAVVLGALRAILPLDSTHDLDPALESCVPAILQRLSDEDVSVRQAAVMALRAYLQSRTALVLKALPPFLPSLYDLTRVRTELQRQVRMGPFTVMHDDGLDLRKNALETLGTLLDTPLARDVAPDVLACVVRALQDDDGVKLMGCLLAVHVADVAGEAVRRAIADLAPPLQAILARQVRDNATKQDMEKASEIDLAARRVVKRLAQLDPASPAMAELLERAATPSAVRRAA
ncbi:unnamed protein product [Malassezia sympodialis ATCC 42132]|uniref:uncharacterized protein n=1 Tax=Malassezia sympodialis (strain ATCC 42132) TaxID=1230383 RepID=UPI0002C21973|nr:uncharacterized protein MSY001_2277 [Malassezia sympodialis ATCC 42132]CCU99571.1 unnamed protein product [Malassezia sympodialis ATCC 42132]|eukprot:XP_018740812.1 uncharacterized protein MSY001_2277 [Malassezia sympodialis ATCC 42132]